MKKKKPLWKRMLLRAGAFVLAAALIAIFYVAVVMAEPKGDEGLQTAKDQPVLNASPAVNITSDAELQRLLASFPAQVLCCPAGGGLRLISGTSYDIAYDGGFARVAEIEYEAEGGSRLKAVSIYPARATELLGKGDYVLSSAGGASIAGILSVRMENADTVRMHMQGENGLYAVMMPKTDPSALTAMLRPLQLLKAE